jgi:hypothetical protein
MSAVEKKSLEDAIDKLKLLLQDLNSVENEQVENEQVKTKLNELIIKYETFTKLHWLKNLFEKSTDDKIEDDLPPLEGDLPLLKDDLPPLEIIFF